MKLIQPSITVHTEIPEVQRALDEAEAHMAVAQGYYETALVQHEAGQPWQFDMAQAQLQLGAAALCQQQANLFLTGIAVASLETEDETEEPCVEGKPLKESPS